MLESSQELLNFGSISQLPLGLRIGLVGLWVVAVIGLAEGLDRWTQWSAESVRKVVHMGVGNVILLAWWLNLPAWVGITAAVLSGLVTLISYWTPLLASINGVGRKSWGTFFYAISIGVLVAWFWPIQQPQFAALGVLMMTWGDGLAAIAGQRWGQHPYQLWGMQKSWEGSLTMLGVSFVIALLLLQTLPLGGLTLFAIALAVSLWGTFLEAFSKFGLDNLTVPIGSAAIGFYLCQILA